MNVLYVSLAAAGGLLLLGLLGLLEERTPVSEPLIALLASVLIGPAVFGVLDQSGGDSPNDRPRAANELTITEWDPVSKQPLFKVGAVGVTKVADSAGEPAPAPTNTASAPVSNGSMPETTGGVKAEATETLEGRG